MDTLLDIVKEKGIVDIIEDYIIQFNQIDNFNKYKEELKESNVYKELYSSKVYNNHYSVCKSVYNRKNRTVIYEIVNNNRHVYFNIITFYNIPVGGFKTKNIQLELDNKIINKINKY